ncbi:MAG: type II toxin-antitoxin system VapC family toxin [Gaiellaceae bacterium]
MSVFIDANVPMYAGGSEHSLRESARGALRQVVDARLDGVTDCEVLQELLHRYIALGRRDSGFVVFDSFASVMRGRVLPVDVDDVERARELADELPELRARDLLHLAVMQRHAIEAIVTADRHFDGIPGIRRLPLEPSY